MLENIASIAHFMTPFYQRPPFPELAQPGAQGLLRGK
jgi:hypothetical protein